MRLLIIAAFLSIAAAAQNPAQIQPTPTTPSGACNSTAIRLLTPNGTIYTCQGGTWAASSGSGGGFDTADCQVLTASGGTFTVPASTTTGCFGISFTTTANVSMPTPVTGSSRKIILTYTNVTPTTGSPITYTGATSSGLAQPVSPSANAITTVTAYWNATTSSWGPQAAGTTPSCGAALSAGQMGAIQSSGCTGAATAHNLAVPISCSDSSGSTTVKSCVTSPSFTPVAGDAVSMTSTSAMGASATLSVNGATAAPIYAPGGSAVVGGEALANKPVTYTYDAVGHWDMATTALGASGSGSNITRGAFSALPGTCTTKDLYIVTSGFFEPSYCSATNTWAHTWNGYAITPASALSLSTVYLQTAVTTASTNGYEAMTFATTGSPSANLSLRGWTPPTAPYTDFLVVSPGAFVDNTSYRCWSAGWVDSTKAGVVIQACTGNGVQSGIWERVITSTTSGAYNSTLVGPLTSQTGNNLSLSTPQIAIPVLYDDGTNINFGISMDGKTYAIAYSESRTSHLSGGPSQIVYGGVNQAGTAIPYTVNLIGVLQ